MINLLKINITITFLLFTIANCISQDSATVFKIKYHTIKAEKYLTKEKGLFSHYAINANGISIYKSAQHKLKGDFEFHISWDKVDDFNLLFKNCNIKQVFEIYSKGDYDKTQVGSSVNSSTEQITIIGKNKADTASSTVNEQAEIKKTKKLKGKKIALDPGHIAGEMEMGDIEKKCLTFKCSGPEGLMDSIAIAEGALTFATAQLLKDKLTAEGAEVFMTRNFNGSSAYGVTFDSWLKTDFRTTVDSLFKVGKLSLYQKQFFLSDKASKRDKFRVIFKDLELAKRADIINNYQPDFTIIIHYNVDETNTDWLKPANRNFNMAFVGGAFMKNDLSTPEKRFAFLRLLISSNLEKSISLSLSMVKSFEENLKVKTASVTDAGYLSQGCLPAGEPGVYCRNLQMTRYVQGPLVYGETLYQDNMQECIALNKESDKTKNLRVQQVAEAYFQGVLNYVKKQ